MTIKELREKMASDAEELQKLIDTADKEGRDLTPDEETRFNELSASIDESKQAIEETEAAEEKRAEMRQRVDSVKADLSASANKPTGAPKVITHKRDVDEEREFRSVGEFLYAVARAGIDKDVDKRLEWRQEENRADQMMKLGSLGGFAVPDNLMAGIMQVEPQEAIVRPRATIVSSGSEATIKFNYLNQNGTTNNMFGGFTVVHDGESDALTNSNATIEQGSLTPKRLTGYTTLSVELLNNWAGSSAFFTNNIRKAISAAEDNDFLTGSGVNRALGITQAGGRIDYARATANQISYADIINMIARLLMRGGSPVWIASQSTLPQLATIRDTGNNNLWIQSIQPGVPNTLAGYPVLWNERSAQLGTAGDLILADLSEYLIADGSPMTVAMSEHARFANGEVAFRVMKWVDGQPSLDAPLTPENGGDTLSPFIVLN